MRELRLRTAGPALVLVLELEAPPRLLTSASTQSEASRLSEQLCSRPSVCRALIEMLAVVDAEHAAAWHRDVEPGGGSRADL